MCRSSGSQALTELSSTFYLSLGSGESAITKAAEDVSLTEVLKSVKSPLYNASNLPPAPISYRNYKWVKSPDQPPVDQGIGS